MNEKTVVLKNAAANVLRGTAAALVAIALPPVLTRAMSTEAYGAWALVLQVSAYVAYLDFGLQTAVARFVAHSSETRDWNRRDSVVSTAAVSLAAAAVVGMLASIALALAVPGMFRRITPAILTEMRVALFLVAGSMAIGLPISSLHGVFIGLQRNELSALIISASRLGAAFMIAVAATQGYGLRTLALITAGTNIASYAAAYVVFRARVPGILIRLRLFSAAVGKELAIYCYSLMIWSASMLLISGLDLTIVGVFDYPAVSYYAVASSLVIFVAGIQNAIFSALMPAAAVLDARGSAEDLGRMLVSSTRYSTFLLFLTGIPLVIYGPYLLNLWVGPAYADHTILILRILVVANVVRLTLTPYAVILIGTGQQRLVTASPVVEGVINLVASVVAAKLFGAMGVAVGTLVGAAFCVAANYFYNMPRTTSVHFRFYEYIRDGIVMPGASVLALTLPLLFSKQAAGQPLVAATIGTAAAWLTWRVGLLEREKKLCKKVLSLLPFTA
jgi:O-antigen/teichoic acid export membrane protein